MDKYAIQADLLVCYIPLETVIICSESLTNRDN